MKKVFVVLLVAFSFLACKNESKQTVDLEENRAKSYDQQDGLITMHGDFLYDEAQKAAVFEMPNGDIYGVVVDDNMLTLHEQVKPFKTNEYTSVPVTIRVKRTANTDQNILWKNIIEVKDILKVEAPDPNKKDVIQLAN